MALLECFPQEDGFLGSVLPGHSHDLEAQGAIYVLESSELFYVEFLDHNTLKPLGLLAFTLRL